MTAKLVVDARGLLKTFKDGRNDLIAVNDVDLSVKAQEVLWIAGPSGSGKSTLLSLLGCILKANKGDLILDNVDIGQASVKQRADFRLRKIGFIFQDFNLIESVSIGDNVQLPMQMLGSLGRNERKGRARELLSALGVEAKVKAKPSELSGGEKQRVAIARALANSPAIILADEPTANLDEKNGRFVMELLRHAAETNRSAVVIASHDDRIESFVHRRLVLRDGAFDAPSNRGGLKVGQRQKTDHK